MMSHPMGQDGCKDVRSGTNDVMGRFWCGFDHDWRRNPVSPTSPILVEVEDDELSVNPIVKNAMNDPLS